MRSSGDSAGLGSRVSAPHGEECRKRSSFVIVALNGSEYTFWTSPLALLPPRFQRRQGGLFLPSRPIASSTTRWVTSDVSRASGGLQCASS